MLPKYQKIADILRARLIQEDDARLRKLPTEKELCSRFSVSRQTVRQALLVLESEGLITRRQGSGAYATGLHTDSSKNVIAVLLPTDSEYIYPKLKGELYAPLHAAGFTVSFLFTDYSIAKERELLMQLLKQPPRGLITDPVKNALPNPNLDLYEKLWQCGVETVFLHVPYENFPPRTAICEDNTAGAAQLTHYLLGNGHSRIGGIFRLDTIEGRERYLGFLQTCTAADIAIQDSRIGWYDTSQLLALQKRKATGFLTDFIQKNTDCSAIICQDDEIAYALIKELSAAGIHVPEDKSIVSFDNSYLCEFSTPSITSLALTGSLGSCSADALLRQLRGKSSFSMRMGYTIRERDSSAPFI